MMSAPAYEDVPPCYETLMSSTPSSVPVSNVPVASFFQNVSPPSNVYYVPPTTQTWSGPTVAPQWHLSAIVPQNMDPSLPFFQTFLKGKPKALGIVVLVAAILEIGLGIVLAITHLAITLISGTPFWGPVFYIIAGSLTVAAQKKPNICLIKGSLSLNIISSIFSMVAVILNIIDFLTNQCYSSYSYNYYGGVYYDYDAQRRCQQQLNGSYAVLSLYYF
ncbi:unnamed protein product [Staurois parvus]|uniref:Uncharacterized protein n=1 Tax=Staurois parvus TaxID=386267 RepID=A0ABN9HDY5_9NEOB|nr:unnamed protein product [Staurois parvus]